MKTFNYDHLIASVEIDDIRDSQDQYLLFCWELNLSLPVVAPGFKFPKRVVTFFAAGILFFSPKVSFAKEYPKNSSSSNNFGIVVYHEDGKPKTTIFDPAKKELALAAISQKKNAISPKKNMSFDEPPNVAVVVAIVSNTPPASPPASLVSVPVSPSENGGVLMVQERPVIKLIAKLLRNKAILRKSHSVVTSKKVKTMDKLLQEEMRKTREDLAKMKKMRETAKREQESSFLLGGLDSSQAQNLDMSVAQKEAQIRYYRFLSRAILFISGISMAFLAYNYYNYVKKSHNAFENLLSKYLRNRAKNVESAKLHAELFEKWEKMVQNHRKALHEKNSQIKKIEATSVNEISSLHLLINMLTDDRDALLKEVKFLKEHGSP